MLSSLITGRELAKLIPRSSSTSVTPPRTIFWALPCTRRPGTFFSGPPRKRCSAPIANSTLADTASSSTTATAPGTSPKIFWDATPDVKKIFVADPAAGSRHNRGCAVDLSLYDLTTGEEVKMPSGYDEMTDRAYADYAAARPKSAIAETSCARPWKARLQDRSLPSGGTSTTKIGTSIQS